MSRIRIWKNTFSEGEYSTKAITRGNYEKDNTKSKKLFSEQDSNESNKKTNEKTSGIYERSGRYLFGEEVIEENSAAEYNSTAKTRERLTRYENEAYKEYNNGITCFFALSGL